MRIHRTQQQEATLHADSVAAQAFDFERVVGHQRVLSAPRLQRQHGDPVIPKVIVEAEVLDGLNRVETLPAVAGKLESCCRVRCLGLLDACKESTTYLA